jgi:soluble cytochrome b562
MRYAALSELITERIALQEARSAGVKVSEAELQAAVDSMRVASGLDEKAFEAKVVERYGSMKAYRKGLELRLVLRKFIDEKVTAGARDAADANERMSRWLQGATTKAAVRISLDEQPPSAGCSCCSSKTKANGTTKQGCDPKGGCGSPKGPSAGGVQASGQEKAAQDAALAYWQQRNGSSPVETKVTDFGCHIQVDIVANDKIAKSLRYQNGAITEM